MQYYIQELICDRVGRRNRYQVMPLDGDGRPSHFFGSSESPTNQYGLVDLKTNSVVAHGEYDCFADACDDLMLYVKGDSSQ
jgi:hypothetical protein